MGSSASTLGSPGAAGAYAVEVYRPLTSGETGVYRSTTSPHQLTTALDGVNTLYENFLLGCAVTGDGPMLGTRAGAAYTWLSYDAVKSRAIAIGAALAHRGLGRQAMVGLYSKNCAEWVLIEQGCNAYSLVTVPLYDTLGPDAVEYIAAETALSTIACTADKTASLLQVARNCPSLKLAIEMDGTGGSRIHGGVTVIPLAALEAEGRAYPSAPRAPLPTDVTTICYTSGTTGNPSTWCMRHVLRPHRVQPQPRVIPVLPCRLQAYLHLFAARNTLCP
jgi:long-chain acyl-CoA synthetase